MNKNAIMIISRNLILSATTTLLLALNSCHSNKQEEKEMPAPLIDVKTFFKNPTKSGFSISPDGKYFGYRDNYKGKLNLFVQKTTDTICSRVTNDTLRNIIKYFWKGD